MLFESSLLDVNISLWQDVDCFTPFRIRGSPDWVVAPNRLVGTFANHTSACRCRVLFSWPQTFCRPVVFDTLRDVDMLKRSSASVNTRVDNSCAGEGWMPSVCSYRLKASLSYRLFCSGADASYVSVTTFDKFGLTKCFTSTRPKLGDTPGRFACQPRRPRASD